MADVMQVLAQIANNIVNRWTYMLAVMFLLEGCELPFLIN